MPCGTILNGNDMEDIYDTHIEEKDIYDTLTDEQIITDLVGGYTRYLSKFSYKDSNDTAQRLIKSARNYEHERFPKLLDRARAWDGFVSLLPRIAMYQDTDGQDLVRVSDIMEYMREKGILQDENT